MALDWEALLTSHKNGTSITSEALLSVKLQLIALTGRVSPVPFRPKANVSRIAQSVVKTNIPMRCEFLLVHARFFVHEPLYCKTHDSGFRRCAMLQIHKEDLYFGFHKNVADTWDTQVIHSIHEHVTMFYYTNRFTCTRIMCHCPTHYFFHVLSSIPFLLCFSCHCTEISSIYLLLRNRPSYGTQITCTLHIQHVRMFQSQVLFSLPWN